MTKRDDDRVLRAYLRRITGYDVTEVHEEYKVNEEGRLELAKETRKTKHVPGDPRAAEFWLTNRQPGLWRPSRLLGAAGPKAEETGIIEFPPVEDEEGGADG